MKNQFNKQYDATQSKLIKPVICFGEALIDFLNTGSEKEGCLSLNNFRQYPGGAPANAAVAVAKLGGNAFFAGQVGNDMFGDFIESSLAAYQVDTRYLSKHPTAKTALAFVALDQDGERTFSFHRENSADMLFSQNQVRSQWFETPSILHFCSNTLTEKNIELCTEYAVNTALEANVTVSFDVNLRHNLWPNGKVEIGIINNLIHRAHILKFSREEFDYLSNGNPEGYLAFCLNWNCQLLIITDGAKPIVYHTKKFSDSVHPPITTAVDTTAGGDGFIGGVLFSISKFNQLSDVTENEGLLKNIIQFSAQCGAIAVSKSGAFPALATLEEVLPQLSPLPAAKMTIPTHSLDKIFGMAI